MSTLFDLSTDIAIVIGATGTLGGVLADGLAKAGAAIAVVGRNQERGQARADEIRKAGGLAEFFSADACDRETLRTAHGKIVDVFGHPTILVNAAGGNDPKVTVTPALKFEEISVDAWKTSFDLNVVGGAFLACQEFGSAMVKRGRGSIINIASVAAHVPLSRVVAYSAAKAAVVSLTQFLAREWAASGVRVNSITPGFFPAEQNRSLLFDSSGAPTDRARTILAHTPAGRFGEPHELVGAAVFLASQSASGFVTGIDLRVDGGFLSQTI